MELSEFDYHLPLELIAQTPVVPRDSSRLLVVNGKDSFCDKNFTDIVDYFQQGDVLVVNASKVLHAKLIGKKQSGSPAEIVLEKKVSDTIWHAKIKTKRPRKGTIILIPYNDVNIQVRVIDQINDSFVIEIDDVCILENAILPTPPYITRKLNDTEYQTVYAIQEGSLAAPTAGLHFTSQLLEKIKAKGVQIVYVTLHVSYGTFKNISTDIENHIMDPELVDVDAAVVDIINQRKGRLIVVGTTSLKALETACTMSTDGSLQPYIGESSLFIYPGYKFKSGTDILITNFHLPKSTLLLLVSAFTRKEIILSAYAHAIRKKYRFFSLGDAMLIYFYNSNNY